MAINNDKHKKHKFIAPFYIVKRERSYLLWILIVLLCGLINIWGGYLLGDDVGVKEAFESGIIYTYSISICSPFVAEFAIKQLVSKRRKEPVRYLSYQMYSFVITFVWILILTFLWLGKCKGVIQYQIVIGTLSTIYAFYMYCVSQMEHHDKILSEYDDPVYEEYLKKEKDTMENTSRNSKNLKTINSDKGEIEI